MAPVNSSYTVRHNLDILSHLEQDINYLSQYGNIVICGDLNARTGCQSEIIDNDNSYIDVPQHVRIGEISKSRRNKDMISNSRGKDLLDLCTSANLVILNGRTLGDSAGNFTCFQYNGNSTVDYCIVSEEVVSKVLYFQVDKHLPLLSDHSCISVKIFSKFKCEHPGQTNEIDHMPQGYIWDETSPIQFINALNSTNIQNKLLDFNTNQLPDDPNKALGTFNNILYEACNISLKRRRQ